MIVVVAGAACVAKADDPPSSAEEQSPVAAPTDGGGVKSVPVPPAVARLLAQPYLTQDEHRDLRVRFGVWTPEDLNTPLRRAKAALIAGAYGDASLDDPAADALDRAEARLNRGEANAAIELLASITPKTDAPLRAVRLHAQALMDIGKAKDALSLLDGLAKRLIATRLDNADELVEGVRGMMLRTRLTDTNDADSRSMLSMLARAREELDRLCWPALLVEAQLLEERDNTAQAIEALMQAMTLNPSVAEGWSLSGKIAVDSFNFKNATGAAVQLRGWGALLPGGGEGQAEKGGAISWRADVIEARAALRQRDAEAAAKALAPSLEKFTNVIEVKAMNAAIAAASFDTDRTMRLLSLMDTATPEGAAGFHLVGKTLAEMRQYEDALAYLSEAVRRAPKWAEPWNDLGLMLVQAGKDEAALGALETAASLDPFNTSVANSLTLVRELRTYARIESEHYIIRCKPGVDEILAREMVEPLEANYARVTGDGPGGIRWPMKSKTVIELYPDHHWFSVRVTGMPQVHTIAAATGPVIAMEAPRDGPGHLVGPYDWVRVLRHEFTHTVTLARTKNRLPHWFTEAAAVYLEDAPRDYSACQLVARAVDTDTLFDFDEINNAFVRPKKATDRSQAYAQGHLMYEYLVQRFGPEAPLKLMDQYAIGRTEAQAFQSELGTTREEFMSEFSRFARDQAEAWGLVRPQGAPSYRELMVGAIREMASAIKNEGEKESDKQDENANDAIIKAEPGAKGDDEDLAAGAAVIDKMLQQHPKHPDVLESKLQMELKAAGGKPTPAMVELIERYAAARPVDPLPHKLMAMLALTGGIDGALVVRHLEWLDAREQHSPAFAVELARRAAAASDWPKAWAHIRRATQIAPYDATIREQAASVAIKAGDLAAAERMIVALVALEPDRPQHPKRLEAIRGKRGGK